MVFGFMKEREFITGSQRSPQRKFGHALTSLVSFEFGPPAFAVATVEDSDEFTGSASNTFSSPTVKSTLSSSSLLEKSRSSSTMKCSFTSFSGEDKPPLTHSLSSISFWFENNENENEDRVSIISNSFLQFGSVYVFKRE